jgi:hypothetical protein
MKAHAYTLLASLVLLSGCRSYTYINDVDLPETRRIDPASVSRLPPRLTVAQIFRTWGPGAAGKELIYVYRSKKDSERIFVLAAPPEPEGAWLPGDAEIIKIGLAHDGGRPLIIWESEVKNENIDRLLLR